MIRDAEMDCFNIRNADSDARRADSSDQLQRACRDPDERVERRRAARARRADSNEQVVASDFAALRTGRGEGEHIFHDAEVALGRAAPGAFGEDDVEPAIVIVIDSGCAVAFRVTLFEPRRGAADEIGVAAVDQQHVAPFPDAQHDVCPPVVVEVAHRQAARLRVPRHPGPLRRVRVAPAARAQQQNVRDVQLAHPRSERQVAPCAAGEVEVHEAIVVEIRLCDGGHAVEIARFMLW